MRKALHGCWPTDKQELLLKACLLPGNAGTAAWDHWKQYCVIEKLDRGSLRLLPLLYKNLLSLNIEHSLLNQFRVLYQQTWVHNNKILDDFSSIQNLFAENGIPTILLKGAALILQYYKDPGLRPIADVDVLVPRDKRMQSIHVLAEQGWRPINGIEWSRIVHRMSQIKGVNLTHDNHVEFDLHWHLLNDFIFSTAEEYFWKNTISLEMNGMQTAILDPTDQLFHTLLHGHRWNNVPPIRWIADAVTIYTNAKYSIEWDRMVDYAQRYRLTLRIRKPLHYLCREFNMSVPEAVFSKLQSIHINKIEMKEYDFLVYPVPGAYGLLRAIKEHYYRHKRLASNCRQTGKKLSFRKYLTLHWNIKYSCYLPFYIIYRFIKKIVSFQRTK